MRGGAFKPRSSPYSFQGLGEDGLRFLAEAREETGLPIITEVMKVSDTNLTIIWKHPCDRAPTSHYIIMTLLLSTGIFFSTQPPVYTELPPNSTSTTINNLVRKDGNIYTFVVTAVSGDICLSSQPEQFKIRKCTIMNE